MIEAKACWCDGYLMRSHAEATWAGLLSCLGITYLYEHDLWHTKRHGLYLPDFFVPAADCYLEVKGEHPTQVEIEKAEDLMAVSGKLVVFGYSAMRQAVFDNRLLPMGGMMLVPNGGRWVKVPLTAIGEMVYGYLGEAQGIRFAGASEPRPREVEVIPGDREAAEAMIATYRKPLNQERAALHRQMTRGEEAAARASTWLIAKQKKAGTMPG